MRSEKIQVVINLNALSHNLKVVRKLIRNSTHITAVIKANAYGHGAVNTAKFLEKEDVTFLGVAFVDEAVELRSHGIKKPILVFFEPDPINLIIKHNITPVIHNYKNASAISKEATKKNIRIPIHLNIDTGMGRMGVRAEKALSEILKIVRLNNIILEGVMTHFPFAELSNMENCKLQLKKFLSIINQLKEKGVDLKYTHISNSAAVLNFHEAHLNMVRPGIMLYGYGTQGDHHLLKPVMTVKSKIVYLKKVPSKTPISYGGTFITKRESYIATIPAGYADGYNRLLSNRGDVLIHGRRVPVIGRICMDLFMVDVTEIEGIAEGDEVVLLGKQRQHIITATEIAEIIGTINYEVLTSINPTLKRVYIT